MKTLLSLLILMMSSVCYADDGYHEEVLESVELALSPPPVGVDGRVNRSLAYLKEDFDFAWNDRKADRMFILGADGKILASETTRKFLGAYVRIADRVVRGDVGGFKEATPAEAAWLVECWAKTLVLARNQLEDKGYAVDLIKGIIFYDYVHLEGQYGYIKSPDGQLSHPEEHHVMLMFIAGLVLYDWESIAAQCGLDKEAMYSFAFKGLMRKSPQFAHYQAHAGLTEEAVRRGPLGALIDLMEISDEEDGA